jgi:hypothetical protein
MSNVDFAAVSTAVRESRDARLHRGSCTIDHARHAGNDTRHRLSPEPPAVPIKV